LVHVNFDYRFSQESHQAHTAVPIYDWFCGRFIKVWSLPVSLEIRGALIWVKTRASVHDHALHVHGDIEYQFLEILYIGQWQNFNPEGEDKFQKSGTLAQNDFDIVLAASKCSLCCWKGNRKKMTQDSGIMLLDLCWMNTAQLLGRTCKNPMSWLKSSVGNEWFRKTRLDWGQKDEQASGKLETQRFQPLQTLRELAWLDFKFCKTLESGYSLASVVDINLMTLSNF